MEKETATHSSILARKMPWIEEPGGLQRMGLQESSLATKPSFIECSLCARNCSSTWNTTRNNMDRTPALMKLIVY